MKFVADLHLHSHFSRATSKNLNLEYLNKWAQLKGIQVLGTGDIAHPGWLAEMKKKLEPAEEGLFKLKNEYSSEIQQEVFPSCRGKVRFMLAGEISNIYKKNDKVRKIHNVVFLPSFDAVEKFQARLDKIGNIRADGRPILGLDARDLFEIVLETDKQGYLIPAHIWTPWFSLLGSMSGFDSVEECFADLTPHIFALETGLSSDPPMNWRLSQLDRYTLVSNSDAHSPPKLGREANLFDTDLSYTAIFDALKNGGSNDFLGTIEFFPEEGKYHFDGHRKCELRWDPKTTLNNKGICPECGRAVTVGVMHRVETLADRNDDEISGDRLPFNNLIPLQEVLAEIHRCGVNTKKVNQSFELLLSKLGSELHILQSVPLEDLEKFGGSLLSEGIRRMRQGEVKIAAGFDGEYGTIHLFNDDERERYSTQLGFFKQPPSQSSEKKAYLKDADDKALYSKAKSNSKSTSNPARPFGAPVPGGDAVGGESTPTSNILADLNEKQKDAVLTTDRSLIIVAGPGTGKTRTLTRRIAFLLHHKNISPKNILALTFTNRAAQEMVERLDALVAPDIVQDLTIQTFHAFGASMLSENGVAIGIDPGFVICSEKEKKVFLKQIDPSLTTSELNLYSDFISKAKNHLVSPDSAQEIEFNFPERFADMYESYQQELSNNKTLDFDDLIFKSIQLLEQSRDIREGNQERFRWISVDEYQDINYAQYQLLKLLVNRVNNICVIGDPDQSIYGFRGSKREFFLRFHEDFPNAKSVNLNRNYRSTQLICDASQQIISKDSNRMEHETWSEIVSQTKIDVYRAATDKAEAEFVVHEIEKQVGGTSYFSLDSGRVTDESSAEVTFSDFAVLYRLNAQSHPLQEAFGRSGMPFQILGETPFYERSEVKKLLAFLEFQSNPDSNIHLQSILLNFAEGIGPELLKNLLKTAEEQGKSLWKFLQEVETFTGFKSHQKAALRKMAFDLKALLESNFNKNIAEQIHCVIDKFYTEKYFEDDHTNQKLLNQLLLRTKKFDNRLKDFLISTKLHNESDDYDPKSDRVTLMTLHAAKGLEFPVVFIVGCEDYLIPYCKDGFNMDLEEERRLFYVGMTRAEQRLILIHAKTRFLFGNHLRNQPSRFLNDIENSLKEIRKQEEWRKKEDKKQAQLKLF